MIFNSAIIFLLVAYGADRGRGSQQDKIHFGSREISNSRGNRRAGLSKRLPVGDVGIITFLEDSHQNSSRDTNKWNYRGPYNSSSGKYEAYQERDDSHVNRPFHQMTGDKGRNNSDTTSNNSFGNGNGNREWGSNWRGNRRNESGDSNRPLEGFRHEQLGSNFNLDGNQDKSVYSGGGRGGTSKRKLLPEDSCGTDLPRRILGGSSADIDEFPWVALLQYRDGSGRISHDCGGVLISSRYVLTAAHCTIGLGVTTRKLRLEKVRLGEWDLSTEEDCQQEICSKSLQDIGIEEIINHERYRAREKSQTNDIALLRLREEAEMNEFVHPICLPFDGAVDIAEGKRLAVSGWGRTSNAKNSNSNIKMKVEVPAVTWDNCRRFYESFFNDVKIAKSQMCAGGEEGKDSCQGDSGGPLMSAEKIGHEFRWLVVGIVSSGPAACGVQGRPSLYTRVSDFKDWIFDNIRK